MNLDPAKLLVIFVIAFIVLGPERLPRVARQLGAFLHELSQHRARIVDQLREQVPELPQPGSVRSFLFDSLTREQARELRTDPYAPFPSGPGPRPLERARFVPAGDSTEADDPSMN